MLRRQQQANRNRFHSLLICYNIVTHRYRYDERRVLRPANWAKNHIKTALIFSADFICILSLFSWCKPIFLALEMFRTCLIHFSTHLYSEFHRLFFFFCSVCVYILIYIFQFIVCQAFRCMVCHGQNSMNE